MARIRLASLFAVLAILLGLGIHAASAYTCTTSCYGYGNGRTCTTTCF